MGGSASNTYVAAMKAGTTTTIRIALAAVAFAGSCWLASGRAEAGTCGTFTADDGDNIILVGQAVDPNAPPITGDLRRVGICWRDRDGVWQWDEVPTCKDTTRASDRLKIIAGAGDDIVMPVVREDRNLDFVCPVYPAQVLWPYHVYPGDIDPDGPDCRSEFGCSDLFDFGMDIEGGHGEDQLYGSPNDDRIRAAGTWRYCSPWFGCFTLDYDDDYGDALCGLNGRDLLYGDRNRSDTFAEVECLDGGHGYGSDVCDGRDEQWDISPTGTCETRRGVFEEPESYDSWGPEICCWESGRDGCAPPFDDTVEQCVCDADASCCSSEWDASCVAAVESLGCGSCEPGRRTVSSGCWETCQYRIPDYRTSASYIVPPLYPTLREAWGPDFKDDLFMPQIRSGR
jgi:hypothetical protein